MTELLSARQFAERANVDEKQIRRALSRGLLHRDRDGLLDATQLHAPWRKPNSRTLNKRSAAHPVAHESSPQQMAQSRLTDRDLVEAQLRKEQALAGLRALELGVKSGQLIPFAQAHRAVFEHARAMRDHWLNWPARIAPHFAAELGIEPESALCALTHLVYLCVSEIGEFLSSYDERASFYEIEGV